jgi:heterodisulfide reductase subunit C
MNPEFLGRALNLERLNACCGACTFECSAALASPDNDLHRFDPVSLVRRVASGDVASVLEDADIWRCLKCHKCARICPFGDGLAPFFEVIQGMALRSGVRAEPVEKKLDLIRTVGAGVPRNRAIRKEFGLPVTEPIDREQLERLLDMGE